ncbi:MAG: hypothetical protein sL5_10060 [Candidatus Mesenet longicola]|uniref:Uncharacterized protein n=1 Tax=Candidatus Mesenet longicola TaxID=1892558 RepID=A0A8J3HQZ9_9RICK|nr:MAG: hypothetical protein sGL2_02840 [Candidatus Mesenet longicola]GHM60013.1 MAG: hypothetical protein sL5_10060 [Candidatus Mesenet longicola]
MVYAIENCIEDLKKCNNKIDELTLTNGTIQGSLAQLQSDYKSCQGERERYNDSISQLVRARDDLRLEYDQKLITARDVYQTDLKNLMNQSNEFYTKNRQLTEERIKLNNEIDILVKKNIALQSALDKFNEMIEGVAYDESNPTYSISSYDFISV